MRMLPEWMDSLNLQQQAVLILALRGPDGFPKYHPSKKILYFYRSFIIAAAHKGRHIRIGEHVGSLMTLHGFDGEDWGKALKEFFKVVDELPLHYFTHLMHGAQVLAYKHPEEFVRSCWQEFYWLCCDYLHTPVETTAEMDKRLNDFGRPLEEVRE